MSFISIEFFALLLTALLAYYSTAENRHSGWCCFWQAVFFITVSGLVNFIFLFVSILTFYSRVRTACIVLCIIRWGYASRRQSGLLGGILVLNICHACGFKLSGAAGIGSRRWLTDWAFHRIRRGYCCRSVFRSTPFRGGVPAGRLSRQGSTGTECGEVRAVSFVFSAAGAGADQPV